jgi:molecular chaperone DnaK
MGGVATKLIERNTTIPTSKSQVFSTASDNQTSVDIHIVQGERPMTSDNKSLGRFVLGDIAPAPRGIPQIEVTFDIDANGILNVKATDKATNKEASITIQSGGGLSDADIKKMQEDAEKFADEDKKKKELVDKRNEAETAIFSAEKSLREYGEKVPAETKTAIEEKIKELKEVKDKDDAAAIDTATMNLSNELMKIYEVIQKAEQEKNAAGNATSETTEESKEETTEENK